jgi:gliding motility associated protien GldN
MSRKFILGILILGISGVLHAQTFKDIYDKGITDNSKIIYPYLREGDVVWAKKIYRMIDLREKANQSLYFPDPRSSVADGRKSFIKIVLDEIKKGTLNAYDQNSISSDSVKAPTTYADIESQMGKGKTITKIKDINTGLDRDTTITTDAKPELVKKLLLYEEWYFDKKLSTMSVRIIAVCPIFYQQDPSGTGFRPIRLCWVKYNDLRDILSRYEVFNPNNDAQRLSFDDLFMQRRFDSYIYGESNVFNDRSINQYSAGKDAMFESERIKKQMADFEHDLWEY